MDRSERILVPEWYRGSTNSGNLSGNSNHQNGSASNPDDHGVRSSSRNRFSRDLDPPRSSRNSTSFRRSVSSNNNGYMNNDRESSSYFRTYSGFSRSHPDRDRKKDFRDRGRPYLLENGDSLLVSRTERDSSMRGSNSTASERRVDLFGKKSGSNSKNVVPGNINIISKPSLEKDFPSLGAAERQSEVPRVLSPGLCTAMDNISKISSTTIGGEGWISALAEVPLKVGGSGISNSSISTPESSPSATLGSSTGLNMAETLAQAPLKNSVMPKLSVDTKKSDELIRAQYSKLIPVTPTVLKSLASNSLEKTKPKGLRPSELSGLSKAGLQLSSQPVTQTFRVPPKVDNTRPPQGGNFQVLTRDRNGTVMAEDSHTLTNASKGVPSVCNPAAVVNPPLNVGSLKPKLDNRGAAGYSIQSLSGEKRVNSQAKNRNDFFNIIRKKTLNRSSELPESSTIASSLGLEKSGKEINFSASFRQDKETPVTDASSECSVENVTSATSSDNVVSELSKGFYADKMSSIPVVALKHVSGVAEPALNYVVENYTSSNNCPMLVAVEPRLAPLTEEGTNSVDNQNYRAKTEQNILPEAVVAQRSLSLCDEDTSPNSVSPLVAEIGDEPVAAPSEEEADFLRRLGWDENADGDEITAEEIEDFVRQHPEQMTTLRLGLIGFGSESLHGGETTSHP